MTIGQEPVTSSVEDTTRSALAAQLSLIVNPSVSSPVTSVSAVGASAAAQPSNCVKTTPEAEGGVMSFISMVWLIVVKLPQASVMV